MNTERRPFVLGVTGGIGSGKTAATDHLQTLGVAVVDADQAARAIMAPGGKALAAVVARFGDGLLLPDGQLDRAALREIVFASPDERRWLEQLTHPLIADEITAQLAALVDNSDGTQTDNTGGAQANAAQPNGTQPGYVVLASPLLLEGEQQTLCDQVLVIDVPEALQIERTMARDGNTAQQVRRIMDAQLPRQQRLNRADHIIRNDGSLSDLHRAVEALHEKITQTLT